MIIPLVGGLISQNPLPTSEDHLRSSPGEKRVTLVLDISGSMAGGFLPTPACIAYNAAAGIDASTYFEESKIDQMKAALTGCVTTSDGIFDHWASQIDFAIVTFGWDIRPRPIGAGYPTDVVDTLGYTRDATALKNAVLGLQPSGNTPMAAGLLEGHRSHQYWNSRTMPNVYTCDQHYNILMTDGIANVAAPDTTFLPCAAPQLLPSSVDPVAAARYAWSGGGLPDAVCQTDGDQPIATYTIGFGNPAELDQNRLLAVATQGGGRYYYAGSATQLAEAFTQILNHISNRTASFSVPSIQTDGLSVGNISYNVSFRPKPSGPWIGNLKSYCVLPPVDAAGHYVDMSVNNDCLFIADGATQTLLTNTTPLDRFTNSRSMEADTGGAGEMLYRTYFNGRPAGYSAGNDPAAFRSEFGPGNNFFSRRHVMTWDNRGYKDARPNTMNDRDIMASGCRKTKLFAYLHGYDPDSVDCTRDEPTALADWPIGAAINSQSALIRWGNDCTVRGNCIVAFGADDGAVHFVDVANGQETAMLVPRELFTPGTVANYPLADILDQPNATLARRPYVDGGLTRVHVDSNGNGIIDTGETAYLVFGLGRGGRGLYFMDISQRFTAPLFEPDTARNPIYPVVATMGNWSADIRDMVAKPYIGRARVGGAAPELVAVFGSGHEWYLDRPTERLNNPNGLVGLQPALDPSNAQTLFCAGGGQFADYNRYSPSGNDLCSGFYLPSGGLCAAVGSGCVGVPRDFVSGNLWYAQNSGPGATPASTIGNFSFTTFDLGAGDWIQFEDVSGNPISDRLTGTHGGPYVVPIWATGPFHVRVHSDGHFNTNRGLVLDSMQWIPDNGLGGCLSGNPCALCDANGDGDCSVSECSAGNSQTALRACTACNTSDEEGPTRCLASRGECGTPNYRMCGTHYPFVVGLGIVGNTGAARINGATPQPFASATADGSVRFMFTKVCPTGVSGDCYDQSRATSRDLQYMTCPIVAEVRAYEEGGVARNFYVGDQCGQMWKFWTADAGRTWNAKRAFVVTQFQPSTRMVATGESRDFRKFDRPVELTVATCKGGRSIGVYWGTGNTARPDAFDNLNGNTVAQTMDWIQTRANLVGAWFDDGSWDTGDSRLLGPAGNPGEAGAFLNLGQATVTTFPSTSTQNGWFMALTAASAPGAAVVVAAEQMLRDPVVFNGVAYFKTSQATSASTPCQAGVLTDRIYAMDACSAAPQTASGATGAGTATGWAQGARDSRQVWSGDTAVGSNIFVYAPKNGSAVVSSGDNSRTRAANLIVNPAGSNRRTKMYLWWRST